MKPLNKKIYGSIGHLPTSFTNGERFVNEGQAKICTRKARNDYDIIVQEKIDGSCCAVAMLDGQLHALGRKGYYARSSSYAQHQLFAVWVDMHEDTFRQVLQEGERLVGEWVAQAHGTQYPEIKCPFFAFDLMQGDFRYGYDALKLRLRDLLPTPHIVNRGCPVEPEVAYRMLCNVSAYEPEGLVYRVERNGKFCFIAKWVRPNYQPGKFLPDVSGHAEVWHIDAGSLTRGSL